MSQLEGFIQVLSSIIPTNLNPRQWIARAEDIKGADQTFENVDALVAFHPFKMKRGMKARVANYPSIGVTSEFVLNEDPALLVNAVKDSIITAENFVTFWDLAQQTASNRGRAWNFSPDGPGGGAPLFPYIDNPDAEANWEPIFDKTKSHRWMRFRDEDAFVTVQNSALQDVKIYTGWTVPIPVNQTFDQGDYIANKFMRRAISITNHTVIGTLQADKWYIVLAGVVKVSAIQSSSRLHVEYLRLFGPDGIDPLKLEGGKIFQYETENTWEFDPGTIVVETTPPPPRIINGLPNNDAVYPADFNIIGNWTDAVPVGVGQLWKIFGPKSVQQQLKGDWLIEQVNEDPNYIRYSNAASPHPDTLTGDPFNSSAADGQPYDALLDGAGWVSVFEDHDFMATRKDDPGLNDYTPWIVEKIREESGEYEDSVYKLGPHTADIGDPTIPAAPTGRDATVEGWSDTPQPESETEVNYVSTVRKFFDGSLKTLWSQPVPYTGKSTFKDDIISDKGDDFKYTIDVDGVETVSPDYLLLTSRVFKGLSKLWENSAMTIEYTWWRVFNNNAPELIEASTDADPVGNVAISFGYMPASGVAGTPGHIRNRQQVVVKAAGVTGKAVFRVRQRVYFTATSFQDFIQEYSVLDISDGLDAKTVVITSDTNLVLWDSGETVMKPVNVQMRYYQNNLNPASFIFKFQKKWSSDTWVLAAGQAGITIANNVITIDPANVNIFSQDAVGQEVRIAIMNWDGDPTLPNPDANQYSDIVTLVKLSSTNVGAPGANSVAALLSNEAHTMILDSDTGVPVAGEIGSAGSAATIVQLYDGATKKDYTTHWTISSVVSDNGNVTFGHVASGTDRKVHVATWGANERRAKCTITIVYGALTFTKEFVIATSLDAAGAIILDIDSNKGFSFDGNDRTAKTLTARVYNDQVAGGLDDPTNWYFKWFVNGIAVQGPTQGGAGNGQTRIINHVDVRFSANVLCMIADNPTDLTGTEVPFRTRLVHIADIPDTQQLIMWTDLITKPTLPPPTTYKGATATVVAGGATWRKSTDAYWDANTPIWASEGAENPAGIIDAGDGKPFWQWTKPHQISGEKGDQGQAGGFAMELYISTGGSLVAPSFGAGGNTSSIAQMVAAGWRSSTPGQLPTTGFIWKSFRFYSSRNGAGGDITFDANGYPVNEVAFAGSTWFPPVRLSAQDGINGINGLAGDKGWSPIPALVAGVQPNTKILQLAGWTGGGGATPGSVGQYIGAGGLTSDINSAVAVVDPPVFQFNTSTGFIQWKYQSEGAGAWRNLYQDAFRGKIITSRAGTSSFTSSVGRWTVVDTGDTSVKNLSIHAYMDAGADARYQMRLSGNNSPSTSGATLLAQRNYMSFSIAVVTQYQLMLNISTSLRYIVLEIGNQTGHSGATTAYFGLTVIRE